MPTLCVQPVLVLFLSVLSVNDYYFLNFFFRLSCLRVIFYHVFVNKSFYYFLVGGFGWGVIFCHVFVNEFFK